MEGAREKLGARLGDLGGHGGRGRNKLNPRKLACAGVRRGCHRVASNAATVTVAWRLRETLGIGWGSRGRLGETLAGGRKLGAWGRESRWGGRRGSAGGARARCRVVAGLEATGSANASGRPGGGFRVGDRRCLFFFRNRTRFMAVYGLLQARGDLLLSRWPSAFATGVCGCAADSDRTEGGARYEVSRVELRIQPLSEQSIETGRQSPGFHHRDWLKLIKPPARDWAGWPHRALSQSRSSRPFRLLSLPFFLTIMASHPPPPSTLGQMSLEMIYNLLAPISIRAGSQRGTFTNWGQTFTCAPLCVFEPRNEYECALVLELARREGKTVRAAGVGHSPSDLACTSGFMLRTEGLDKVLEVSARLSPAPVSFRASAVCRANDGWRNVAHEPIAISSLLGAVCSGDRRDAASDRSVWSGPGSILRHRNRSGPRAATTPPTRVLNTTLTVVHPGEL